MQEDAIEHRENIEEVKAMQSDVTSSKFSCDRRRAPIFCSTESASSSSSGPSESAAQVDQANQQLKWIIESSSSSGSADPAAQVDQANPAAPLDQLNRQLD